MRSNYYVNSYAKIENIRVYVALSRIADTKYTIGSWGSKGQPMAVKENEQRTRRLIRTKLQPTTKRKTINRIIFNQYVNTATRTQTTACHGAALKFPNGK